MTPREATAERECDHSDYPRCPYCGGEKRGWRRLHEEALCSKCERNGV